MSQAPDYVRVGPAIWSEPWDDDTRHVAFYVLTCRHRRTEGLYYLPLEYAIADLKWQPRRFRAAFDELLACGFIEYDEDAQVVLIVNALVWQSPSNPNQVKAAMKVIRELPPTRLLDRFGNLARQHSERLYKALSERFPQRFPEGLREVPREPSPEPPDEPSPQRIADSPSPAPTQEPPRPPKGARQRDQDRYWEEVRRFAAWLFPGADPDRAAEAVDQACRATANGHGPTRDAVLEHVGRWYPDLKPIGGAAA